MHLQWVIAWSFRGSLEAEFESIGLGERHVGLGTMDAGTEVNLTRRLEGIILTGGEAVSSRKT